MAKEWICSAHQLHAETINLEKQNALHLNGNSSVKIRPANKSQEKIKELYHLQHLSNLSAPLPLSVQMTTGYKSIILPSKTLLNT